MSRALVILNSLLERERVAAWARKAPTGTRVEFKAAKRSLPQNDRMWAMLTDVSRQVDWYGQKLTPDDWKDVFTASLRKARVVPSIDGDGFVLLGLHTSDMTKAEMGDLMELIAAFGAERGVIFSDPSDAGDAAA